MAPDLFQQKLDKRYQAMAHHVSIRLLQKGNISLPVARSTIAHNRYRPAKPF